MFFFIYPASTQIYTLSLHDALPICADEGRDVRRIVRVGREHRRDDLRLVAVAVLEEGADRAVDEARDEHLAIREDRKSTRLNSSHSQITYAVFCLKKKTKKKKNIYK